jgi:hypothetical protein
LGEGPGVRALMSSIGDFVRVPKNADFIILYHLRSTIYNLPIISESGGIGRRAGLRIQSRKGSGFKSPLSHLLEAIRWPILSLEIYAPICYARRSVDFVFLVDQKNVKNSP